MKKLSLILSFIFVACCAWTQEADFIEFAKNFNWKLSKEQFVKQYGSRIITAKDSSMSLLLDRLDVSDIVFLDGFRMDSLDAIVGFAFSSEYNALMFCLATDQYDEQISYSYVYAKVEQYSRKKLGVPLKSFSLNELVKKGYVKEDIRDISSCEIELWDKNSLAFISLNIVKEKEHYTILMASDFPLLEALNETKMSLEPKEHFKFMGIPLNGSIDAFSSKLRAKGCTVNYSSGYSPGIKVFNGVFSGEKATICVYYNNSSKNVYGAKAYMDFYGEAIAENKLKYFENMLSSKYPTAQKKSYYETDDYGHRLRNVSFVVDVGNDNFGFISLYIRSFGYSETGSFSLHIQYEDGANSTKNENSIMDDL